MDDSIVPGTVLRLSFSFLQGGPKDKFCVLACLEPKPRLLLISTEPSQLKRDNPQLWACQVIVDAANHSSFLKYDSHIDCTDPYGFVPEELEKQLANDSSRVVGTLSNKVLRAVRIAIQNSPTIPQKQIQWMLDALPNL